LYRYSAALTIRIANFSGGFSVYNGEQVSVACEGATV
jgi:hypothetical protein